MSSQAIKADLSDTNVRLGTAGSRIQQAAGIVGICGLVASAVIGFTGMFGTTHEFLVKSWMQNYLFVLSISLGAFFFVFIQHLTRAGWSTTVRRVAELIAGNLQWAWVGLVPLVALWFSGGSHGAEGAAADGHAHGGWGPGVLFPWADLDAMKAHNYDEWKLVSGKTAYLRADFFWIRALIYVAFWAFAARWYLKRSLAQDETGDIALTSTMQKWSGPMAIGFGLTTTFAAFDWIMSLSPAWFSTMFGVYFFAGCCTSGFAMMILVAARLQALGRLQSVVTAEHYQDLGKLLFGFGMVFWAYIGFSQYMLIWYANIPEETGWFLARQIGGWGTISMLLLFGHFVIPFVAIISKWVKRMPWALTLAAVWMLAFAWLDLFWLVMPVVPEDAMTAEKYMDVVEAHMNDTTGLANPLNFTMLAGVGGVFVWLTIRRFRGNRLLAIRDPRLHEGLSFENQ
ncbi:MAG: quinol:cytochrome C oxidoreductase [Phycisphaera sp.]|nr:quinol:cytochrome C oxidoreductase [Phycisphaera sp.]